MYKGLNARKCIYTSALLLHYFCTTSALLLHARLRRLCARLQSLCARLRRLLVNCPTRWSLLFIFGFLWWSSSWWWWPHIGGGKKFRPLLRAGLTVLVQFFCKMYILWVSRSRKKILADFFWVLPPQKRRFFQRGAKMSEKGAGPLFWHFEIHWNHSAAWVRVLG